MFTVRVNANFSAAHSLRGYRGKCDKLHGHNWTVEAAVAADTLDPQGMVVDFTVLKKRLHKVLEGLDHAYLNDLAYFKKVNPSSENIARFIYDRLKVQGLHSVRVWETENSCAEYREK